MDQNGPKAKIDCRALFILREVLAADWADIASHSVHVRGWLWSQESVEWHIVRISHTTNLRSANMKRHRNSLRTGPPVHCCSLCKAATPWPPCVEGTQSTSAMPSVPDLAPDCVQPKVFQVHKGSLRLSPKSALFVVVAASPRMCKSKQGNIESYLYQESKPINCTYPGLYPYPMLSQSSPFYISQDSSTLPFSPSALNSRKGWLCQELWSPKVKVPVHHETQRES